MKTEFKAKFLQHLNKKKKDGGFTLIELLVVIIIIGILAAIALPSFLSQAAKAKQSEGKSFIGAVNRAQQAYRLENPAFAKDFTALKIGLPTKTNNYTMEVSSSDATQTVAKGNAVDPAALKSYSGSVKLLGSGATGNALCETNEAGAAVGADVNEDGTANCPGGSKGL
jgi:type IV pilus assembly protein PilA